MNRITCSAGLLIALLCASVASAVELAACAGVVDVKSKSRQYFEGKTLMTNLLALEAQGEAKFHPTFAAPSSQCLFEKFDVGATPVQAVYTPHEKGEATLNWRFVAAGAEPREIFVIYDGMASFMADKEVFFVVQEHRTNISYYAMYRDQPTYAVLKPLVIGILDGSAVPLATVRWPPGEKEPEISEYDTKRLK
jgi:hypothetical protein